MAEMRVMLAGGGDERDSRPLDELFAKWVGKGQLLYLPSALVHPSNKAAAYRWVQQTFEPLGLASIAVWMDIAGKTARDLEKYDAVYIGGGNTFYLLHQLRIHRLDLALDQFAREGHPIYGGSAGAIVFGYDITSSKHIDQNLIGLSDLSGMDLALGYTVWCHYTTEDDERISAYVQRTGIPSIALSEKSGAYRENDHLIAAGSEPVIHFTLQGRAEIASGSTIS